MNTSGGKEWYGIGLDTTGFQKDARRVKGEFDKIESEANHTGKNIQQSFNKMGSGVMTTVSRFILPAGAGLYAAFKFKQMISEAYDFEKEFGMSMREVQTISKATQDDLEGISDAIVDMASQGPDDALKLSKAFYQIVSAGYDGAEGLELLNVASKAATAGLTDTQTAADGLTTIMNAWGLSTKNAGKIADVMFKTVERGKTTFGELARNIAQVAPLAAANNIEFEQIFAALQSLTKQGTSTSEAITQIRSSIIGMNEALGDGWSKTMTYQEGLQAIVDKVGGSQTELKNLLGRVEGVNAALALTGEKAKGAAEDLEETSKAAGAMEKAYGTMMEEADNKWSQVHNKWTREMRTLGKAIKAGSTSFADFLNTLLTDTQADIINPRAKQIIEDIALSIDDVTDKEEKLTIVLSKINELRNKRIGELLPSSSDLEEQLPSWLRRNVEALNAGIGLGDYFTPGRTKQAEFEYLNNQIQITKQAEEGLLKLFTEISVKSSEAGNDIKESFETVQQQIESTQKALDKAKQKLVELREPDSTASVTDIKNQEKAIKELEKVMEMLTGVKQRSEKEIKSIKDQIDELYKNLETADENDRKIIASRIIELQKELLLREMIAEAAVKAARNEAVPGKIKPIQQTVFNGDVKPIKKVEAEFDKLNKKIDEGRKKAEQMQNALDAEKFKKTLEVTQEIAYHVQGITDKYAEQLGLTEEQSEVLNYGLQAMSGIADIASGNVIQGAAKLVDSMMGLFLKAPEKLSEHFENVQKQVDKILDSVNITTEALSNLNVDSSLTSITILKGQLKDIAKEAQKLNDTLGNTRYGPRRGSYSNVVKDIVKQAADLNVEIEKLSNRLLGGGVSDDQRKAIEAVLQSYNSLVSEMNAMISDVIGVSVDDLKSSLADAFFEAENAAQSWGDTVNDVIANIAKNQLISELITKPVDQAVNDLLNDFSDDDLSLGDIKKFKDAMTSLYSEVGPAFEEAMKGLEGIGIDFGSNISAPSGLTGAIRREMTEETAGELAGLWRKSSDDTRQIRDYTKISLNHLSVIESNTFNTVMELQNTVNELKGSNSRLEQLISNTKPQQTGRDLGL